MNPPEKPAPPKSADLRSNQVPWGAPKPKATPSPPEPPAKNLSAKKVPWGARKERPAESTAPLSPPPPDAMLTHMPWAVPTRPPLPPPAAPNLPAKKISWSSRKPKVVPLAPVPPPPTSHTTWALPKGAVPPPAVDQAEMEFARELRTADDHEPSAEQLVAYLSRLTSRKGEPQAPPTPQTPYKARPISFEPTRWDIFLQWAHAHRRRLSLGSALFLLIISTAYLLRLVSLNAQIDREWRVIETALHNRYALVPGYVECIAIYSDNESYAFAMAQRMSTAWRKARTDHQIASAAVQMERVMSLLTKVMNRYDQFVPLKDPDQADASANFLRLERQRERSRRETAELVQHYNTVARNFNDKVEGFPGSVIAWLAQLHPHALIFSSDN